METQEETVPALTQRLVNQYKIGETIISEHVSWSLKDNNDRIDAYLNSKHTTGAKDSLDRDKPFFNIVTAAVNIWYRATDIDRKNIKVRSTNSKEIVPAFLASVHLQEWMKRENFGSFLNEWGRVLARYGSAVVKFVKKDGRLVPNVIPWNRLVVDQIDFTNAPVIEILDYTEAQLRQNKAYDQDVVEALCNAKTSRSTIMGQKKDTKADFIRVYEVHGELPLSVLKESQGKKVLKGDDDKYVQQMHVVSYSASDKKGDTDEYTLVSGLEDNPYMITHLIKEDGRVQGIGAVEHLFDAQWMVNHSTKAIKDQLDLASKLIFQTSDGNFVGQNALSAIETGDILVHAANSPITQVQNNSHDISSLQSFHNMWKSVSQEIVSTPDSLMGNTAPSGTAWRQVEALQNEAHSLFEIMTENKGIHIEEMMRNYVIPYLKTKMNMSDEIAATLEEHDIVKIDSIYIPQEAARRSNRIIMDSVLNGETPQQPDLQQIAGQIQGELSKNGNQRFFTPNDFKNGKIIQKKWNEIFKDLEWEVEVDVTGENRDAQSTIATLNTVLQTLATNPAILQDPNAKMVFNKILSEVGTISPLEISTAQAQPIQAPIQTPVAPPGA